MKSDLIKNINSDLRTLHRKWGLNSSFEMSGGFFMNYAQLGLNNLGTNKKNQLTWADFFNLEVGLIPQNEDEWRIVFEKTIHMCTCNVLFAIRYILYAIHTLYIVYCILYCKYLILNTV